LQQNIKPLFLYNLNSADMASRVKIDFDTLYDIDQISADLKYSSFDTVLQNGRKVSLSTKISNQSHELLPYVYNLAFGPLNKQGKIDDKAEISHSDYSRVFSTILFAGLTYLKSNPEHYLGIDGSDNARAYFYYRAIKRNFGYLNQHFRMFGVKYYVRITFWENTVRQSI